MEPNLTHFKWGSQVKIHSQIKKLKLKDFCLKKKTQSKKEIVLFFETKIHHPSYWSQNEASQQLTASVTNKNHSALIIATSLRNCTHKHQNRRRFMKDGEI